MANAGRSRSKHRVAVIFVCVILVWLGCGFWNIVKPLPAGTRVTSLPVRLAESQVDFVDDVQSRVNLLQCALTLIDHAEQLVIVDQSPLSHGVAQRLLARKRQRPNLKIVLITDSRNEVYGGTPVKSLNSLEQSGIIVARTRLERLRDSNPLYSSFYRLAIAWWDDPFEESTGAASLASELRRFNLKSNERQLLVADDGNGGWSSLVMSAPLGTPSVTGESGDVGLAIRGQLAREIATSEIRIATWSTDDDRLPPPPPLLAPGIGTIDARFLSEGAIHTSLLEAIAGVSGDDAVDVMVGRLADRQIVDALIDAAARGARLRILLDPGSSANQAVAAELQRDVTGILEVRWLEPPANRSRLVMVRHRNDLWLNLGSANLTRRDLGDLNLAANLELRMPARATAARAASDYFERAWSHARVYAANVDDSDTVYWRYRISEATGMEL
jgi:hypothetical protein